jgi:hypothetical protein
MKLREHPALLSIKLTTWPPVWVCAEQFKRSMQGEIGVLKEVKRRDLRGRHFFVHVEHDQFNFMGCLMFDDPAICEQVFNLLKSCLGRAIKEIGDMEVDGLLPNP